MKRGVVNTLIIAGVLLSAEAAIAATDILSNQIGTLSLYTGVQQPLTNSVIIRTSASTLNYEANLQENTTSHLHLPQPGDINSTIADYHPWTGGFRLSAGLFYDGKALAPTISPNDNTYSHIGTERIFPFQEKAKVHPLTPYFGFGWGLAPAKESSWMFSLDVGLIYQGTPETSLTTQCGTPLSARCRALQSDTDRKEENFQDTLEHLGWYPVLSAGVTFKF